MLSNALNVETWAPWGIPMGKFNDKRAYARKRQSQVIETDRKRRTRNLEIAYAGGTNGWEIHTPIHWSRDLLGDRLDYWPSRNKFRWRNKTRTGDVDGFIRNREFDI